MTAYMACCVRALQVPVGHWDVDSLTAAAPREGKPLPPRFGGWLAGAELFDAQLFGLQVCGFVVLRPYMLQVCGFVDVDCRCVDSWC